jgi:transformation/transcription domain-associated protein
VYGINEWSSPSTQRKLEVARHEIELKRRSLSIKKQDESRSQKALLSKSDDSNFSEYQHQLLIARESMERAKRELREARNAYSSIVSQVSNKGCASGKTMTITALELQHQGFEIIKILAFINPEYIWSQNDIVRALRWLWRSRGRHYRLLHEEEIPPRYHCESRALGQFLVSYSKANPTDIDVLFDLIRIFVSLSSP